VYLLDIYELTSFFIEVKVKFIGLKLNQKIDQESTTPSLVRYGNQKVQNLITIRSLSHEPTKVYQLSELPYVHILAYMYLFDVYVLTPFFTEVLFIF
jgi:hypothetical protein